VLILLGFKSFSFRTSQVRKLRELADEKANAETVRRAELHGELPGKSKIILAGTPAAFAGEKMRSKMERAAGLAAARSISREVCYHWYTTAVKREKLYTNVHSSCGQIDSSLVSQGD
jgi:hypothetical protein